MANAAVANQAVPRSFAALDLQHRGKILLAYAKLRLCKWRWQERKEHSYKQLQVPRSTIHSSWRCVKRAQLHVPATSMISASRELEYVYLPRLQLAQRRKCACLFRHSRATLFEPREMSSHCSTKTVSLSKYTSYYGLGMVTRASPVLSHRKRLAPGHRPFSSPRFGFWVRLNPFTAVVSSALGQSVAGDDLGA